MNKKFQMISMSLVLLFFSTLLFAGGLEGLTKENINDFDAEGYTPLMRAINQYYRDRNDGPEALQNMEDLLKLGADPNLRSQNYRNDSAYTMCNRTPMSTPIVKLLIRYGADVNQYNGRGHSNILRVAEDLALLEATLDVGLNPDGYLVEGKSTTYLQALIRDQYSEAVETLLKHGADPNKSDNVNSLPLTIAFNKNDLRISEALIKHGAMIHGNQTMSKAIAMENNVALVKLLIEYGADVNEADSRGNTPLHTAYKWVSERHRDMQDIINLLLENGANPTLRNREGKLPHEV